MTFEYLSLSYSNRISLPNTALGLRLRICVYVVVQRWQDYLTSHSSGLDLLPLGYQRSTSNIKHSLTQTPPIGHRKACRQTHNAPPFPLATRTPPGKGKHTVIICRSQLCVTSQGRKSMPQPKEEAAGYIWQFPWFLDSAEYVLNTASILNTTTLNAMYSFYPIIFKFQMFSVVSDALKLHI